MGNLEQRCLLVGLSVGWFGLVLCALVVFVWWVGGCLRSVCFVAEFVSKPPGFGFSSGHRPSYQHYGRALSWLGLPRFKNVRFLGSIEASIGFLLFVDFYIFLVNLCSFLMTSAPKKSFLQKFLVLGSIYSDFLLLFDGVFCAFVPSFPRTIVISSCHSFGRSCRSWIGLPAWDLHGKRNMRERELDLGLTRTFRVKPTFFLPFRPGFLEYFGDGPSPLFLKFQEEHPCRTNLCHRESLTETATHEELRSLFSGEGEER